jgi:uncharacterized protein
LLQLARLHHDGWSSKRKKLKAIPAQQRRRMGNPVVHFEIGCRDSKKTQNFYSSLFAWKLAPMGPAVMIDTGATVSGHFNSLGHEPHHYTIFYVQVDDVQAYLDKAKALGGKTLVPPVDIPSGKFAWMQDPEGNTVGLFKPA